MMKTLERKWNVMSLPNKSRAVTVGSLFLVGTSRCVRGSIGFPDNRDALTRRGTAAAKICKYIYKYIMVTLEHRLQASMFREPGITPFPSKSVRCSSLVDHASVLEAGGRENFFRV